METAGDVFLETFSAMVRSDRRNSSLELEEREQDIQGLGLGLVVRG